MLHAFPAHSMPKALARRDRCCADQRQGRGCGTGGASRIRECGIDGHPEFRPYSIDEVLALVKDRPIGNFLGGDDYHLREGL